jgi:hypothetical protein
MIKRGCNQNEGPDFVWGTFSAMRWIDDRRDPAHERAGYETLSIVSEVTGFRSREVLDRLAGLCQHQHEGRRSPHNPLLVLLALAAVHLGVELAVVGRG